MKLRIVDGNDAGIEHEGRGRRAALAGVVMALGVSELAVPQAQALPVCATSGISACCKITSPGIYQLHANVNVKIASGDCISVQAANVVLIANDHNLATDVDCESNGNNGARASYSFLDASSSSGNGFVNDGAAGLKMTSVAADGNGGNGLLLINTSGALFADFSEADGNGNNGIKVIGGGSNTMVTIDASTNSADGIWFKHSVANTVIETSQRMETAKPESTSGAPRPVIRMALAAAYRPAVATAYKPESDFKQYQRRRPRTPTPSPVSESIAAMAGTRYSGSKHRATARMTQSTKTPTAAPISGA
jgi:hypothetical protein